MFLPPDKDKKMWNFQNIINLSFSPVWRITLSKQKISEFAKIIELHWAIRFNAFTAGPDAPCPPEGLPLHSISQICVYLRRFREVLHRESKQIGKKKRTSEKKTVITFARTTNRCTRWHVHSWAGKLVDFLQCLFHGWLTFAMSPGLFCIKL